MAIIFGLWAECRDAAAARQFAGHFAGLKHTLLTGRTISWAAEPGTADDPDWSVSVMSFDLGRRGICTLQDALETTEAGLRLHHHLLSAPDFRYACVGIEPWGAPDGRLIRQTWPARGAMAGSISSTNA